MMAWVICLVLLNTCLLGYVMGEFGSVPESRSDHPPYKPTWESLDSRPLPEWYDEAKFGIFLHWGVYSVPAFGGAWLWQYWEGSRQKDKPWVRPFMESHYPPDWSYADWASNFHAWWYDPKKWVDIFKKSGAKYVVLTSKHHEGFCNFPSPNSFNWNSKDVGPKRDLVGELVAALRNDSDIHVGLYYSLYEWFNPVYLQDKKNDFNTQKYVQGKLMPDLTYIVNNYKPDVLWADGDWDTTSTYWNSKEFLAWLYNKSPVKDTVVTNDRWGSECACKHGGFYACRDRFYPGKLLKHKWENAMTIDKDYWAHQVNRDIDDFLTIKDLLGLFIPTVSCGGNLLMDVGPTSQGTITPIFQERLMQMGEWLDVNGDAIYGTHPCTMQNDTLTPHVWYTCKDTADAKVNVFVLLLKWPGEVLSLGSVTPTDNTKISLLGYSVTLSWKGDSGGGIDITIPAIPINKMPSLWAWTLKIENLKSSRLAWMKKDFKAWQAGSDDNQNRLNNKIIRLY